MKKYCIAKLLLAIWEIFLHENNRNNNSYRFSYKFAFILFFSFLTNQRQESGFQQVGCLVTRFISAFCLHRVSLYFKAMPNSLDFYKGIFLHVIPVRITVACSTQPGMSKPTELLMSDISQEYKTSKTRLFYFLLETTTLYCLPLNFSYWYFD